LGKLCSSRFFISEKWKMNSGSPARGAAGPGMGTCLGSAAFFLADRWPSAEDLSSTFSQSGRRVLAGTIGLPGSSAPFYLMFSPLQGVRLDATFGICVPGAFFILQANHSVFCDNGVLLDILGIELK